MLFLRQFSPIGTALYFLALVIYLRRETLNPFSPGNVAWYHAAALSGAAILSGVAATMRIDRRVFSTGQLVIDILELVVYGLAVALLVRTWHHILAGVQGDAAFTERRRILTLALGIILLAEALFVVLEFALPPLATEVFGSSAAEEECASTILLGAQDVTLALAWLAVLARSSAALKAAAARDSASLGEPERAGELSAALRRQLVQMITLSACKSAREMETEALNGCSAGAMSAAACRDGDEYTRKVAIRLPTQRTSSARVGWPVIVRAAAPRVFHELRRLAGIRTSEYCSSLSEHATERFTEGRSGAFFYFTEDKQYIIKTATTEEYATLIRILPSYHEHVQRHPKTLINRVLGAHELSLYGQHVRVIIVESCFAPGREIHDRYDLKGSWVGRGGKKRGLQEEKGVLKDLDVRERLHLAPKSATHVGKTLRDDATFLRNANVIDYSLLVGVTKTRFNIESNSSSDANLSSSLANVNLDAGVDHYSRYPGDLAAVYVEGAERYSLGLIDILQDFNIRKRCEYIFKRFVLCGGKGVSVHPPHSYSRRFMRNVVEALIEPPLSSSQPRRAYGLTGVFRGPTNDMLQRVGVKSATPSRSSNPAIRIGGTDSSGLNPNVIASSSTLGALASKGLLRDTVRPSQDETELESGLMRCVQSPTNGTSTQPFRDTYIRKSSNF